MFCILHRESSAKNIAFSDGGLKTPRSSKYSFMSSTMQSFAWAKEMGDKFRSKIGLGQSKRRLRVSYCEYQISFIKVA